MLDHSTRAVCFISSMALLLDLSDNYQKQAQNNAVVPLTGCNGRRE
jgi:hypothetical protein